jgi:hypothetical protein
MSLDDIREQLYAKEDRRRDRQSAGGSMSRTNLPLNHDHECLAPLPGRVSFDDVYLWCPMIHGASSKTHRSEYSWPVRLGRSGV